MYTAMTLPTNVHALLPLLFRIVLFEIRTAVHFFRNKVMKGQSCMSFTARTHTYLICHTTPFIAITVKGKYLLSPKDDHGELPARNKTQSINKLW